MDGDNQKRATVRTAEVSIWGTSATTQTENVIHIDEDITDDLSQVFNDGKIIHEKFDTGIVVPDDPNKKTKKFGKKFFVIGMLVGLIVVSVILVLITRRSKIEPEQTETSSQETDFVLIEESILEINPIPVEESIQEISSVQIEESVQETSPVPVEESSSVESVDAIVVPQVIAEVNLADYDNWVISHSNNVSTDISSIHNPQEDVSVGNFPDNFGNTWMNAYKFWVLKATGYSASESISYSLAGQNYSVLTGTIVGGKLTNGRCTSGCYMFFRIYVDGELQYTSQSFNESTPPFQYEVNIEGASMIKIEGVTDTDGINGECLITLNLKEIR